MSDLNKEAKEYRPRGKYQENTLKDILTNTEDGTVVKMFGSNMYKFGDRFICEANLTEDQKFIAEERMLLNV